MPNKINQTKKPLKERSIEEKIANEERKKDTTFCPKCNEQYAPEKPILKDVKYRPATQDK